MLISSDQNRIAHPCLASFRPSCTPRNDFPHSKQNGLDRGVSNPQNGHILGDPKSPGVVFAKSFLSESAMKLSKVRTRIRCIERTKWPYEVAERLPRTNSSMGRHFPALPTLSRSHINTSNSVQHCSVSAKCLSREVPTEPPG